MSEVRSHPGIELGLATAIYCTRRQVRVWPAGIYNNGNPQQTPNNRFCCVCFLLWLPPWTLHLFLSYWFIFLAFCIFFLFYIYTFINLDMHAWKQLLTYTSQAFMFSSHFKPTVYGAIAWHEILTRRYIDKHTMCSSWHSQLYESCNASHDYLREQLQPRIDDLVFQPFATLLLQPDLNKYKTKH